MGKKKRDIANNASKVQTSDSHEDCMSLVKSADKEVMPQFEKATRNIKIMALVNIGMEIIVFIVAIIAIVFGIISVLDEIKYIGVYVAIAGLVILLNITFRNPLKGIYRTLGSLTKIQIIFHGYLRQVAQIDTTYRQSIASDDPIDFKELLKAIYNIQEAVEQSVDEVTRSME